MTYLAHHTGHPFEWVMWGVVGVLTVPVTGYKIWRYYRG